MTEVLDNDQQAEDTIQSASPGGPCDICFNCGACNPDNMSEFTINLDKLPEKLGDGAKSFVDNNIHIFKAIPAGNVHNVQIGNLLVSGFKTEDGELRLNMTDKFSPEIVTRQGSDYLNPEAALEPKILSLADAKFKPEMRARLIQQRDQMKKATTQPDVKQADPHLPSPISKQSMPTSTETSPHLERKIESFASHPDSASKKITSHEEQHAYKEPPLKQKESTSHASDYLEAGDIRHTPDQNENSPHKNRAENHQIEKTTLSTHPTETVSSKSNVLDATVKIDTSVPQGDEHTLPSDAKLTLTVIEENSDNTAIDLPVVKKETDAMEAIVALSAHEGQIIPLQQDKPAEIKANIGEELPTATSREPKPAQGDVRPELTLLVQTHTEAIHALFDFMTILTASETDITHQNQDHISAIVDETKMETHTEDNTLQVVKFPDHTAAVVKQFLIGAKAKRVDISGVIHVANTSETNTPQPIHEELFVITGNGKTWDIKLIVENGKPVKIVASEQAIQCIKTRLAQYLQKTDYSEISPSLTAEEENQNNLVSISLGYADDTLLYWLSYLQLKVAFFSDAQQEGPTVILPTEKQSTQI